VLLNVLGTTISCILVVRLGTWHRDWPCSMAWVLLVLLSVSVGDMEGKGFESNDKLFETTKKDNKLFETKNLAKKVPKLHRYDA
jgi:hypothetical protein